MKTTLHFRFGLLVLFFLLSSMNFSFGQKILDDIEGGNIDKVQKWLDKGKDLDKEYLKINSDGDSAMVDPFFWAAVKKQKAILLLLLKNKSKFSNRGLWINRAFGISIQHGDLDLIKKIHAEGADVNFNCTSCHNAAPIAIALAHGHMPVYKFLREKGAVVKTTGDYGAIHGASKKGDTKTLTELIEKDKLDVNEISEGGLSPLMYALEVGNLENAKILLAHGADVSIKSKQEASVLNYAALSGNLKALKFFEALFDQKKLDRKNDKNPLIHWAVESDNEIMLQYIISNYTSEIDKTDNEGKNAFFSLFFTTLNTQKLFNLLLKADLDLEATDEKGLTLLDYCKKHKRPDIKKMIEDAD